MNKLFKAYTTNHAFNLSLSRRQIAVILAEKGYGPPDEKLNLAPYNALKRRGLIEWRADGPKLTDEGGIVADLLVLAGFGSFTYKDTSSSFGDICCCDVCRLNK